MIKSNLKFFIKPVLESYSLYIYILNKSYRFELIYKCFNFNFFHFLSKDFQVFNLNTFLKHSKFESLDFREFFFPVTNNSFYSLKWSRIILNFLSSYYRVYRVRGRNPRRLPDYFDSLIYNMNIYTDRSFTFKNTTLSSSHYSLQMYKINNKRMQYSWLNTNSAFNRYFINIPKRTLLSHFFVDKICRTKFEVRGRASNYVWCISSRVRTWGNVTNRVQPFGPNSELYSKHSASTITRWGVSTVCVTYCTGDFKNVELNF